MNSDSTELQLGSDWTPLIITLIGLTNGLRAGAFWRMTSLSDASDYDYANSSYAQALLTEDGTLQVEVRPVLSVAVLTTRESATVLEHGWRLPDGNIPNPHRVYSTGWNALEVAQDIVRTLVSLGVLGLRDLIDFGASAERVQAMETMDIVGETVFAIESPAPRIPAQLDPLPHPSDFHVAAEIMARLVEAGIVDSPGRLLRADDPGGPIRRQGRKYQNSGFSGNDIVGWVIDVTSWATPTESDWISHISELESEVPMILMIGADWALTVRAGQLDSEVPGRLPDGLRRLFPDGYIAWSGSQEPSWFDSPFTSTGELRDTLATHGFVVRDVEVDGIFDPYLIAKLEADEFGHFEVSVPAGPGCTSMRFPGRGRRHRGTRGAGGLPSAARYTGNSRRKRLGRPLTAYNLRRDRPRRVCRAGRSRSQRDGNGLRFRRTRVGSRHVQQVRLGPAGTRDAGDDPVGVAHHICYGLRAMDG